jgi:hypothetical protein
VLEGRLHAGDLALLRLAADLPVELRALREARGAERVALRDEAAGRVHDPFAAVGHGARVDQLAALPRRAEPEPLVGDELVRGEAVVQLHDLHVLRAEARLLVDLLAAFRVRSCPTSLMQLFSSKVLFRSVAIAMPAISTAWLWSLCF